MTKYKNKKCLIDGIWFDSMKEGRRYYELLLMQKKNEISELVLQHKFELIPAVVLKGRRKPAIRYFADFFYKDKNGNLVVEDTKSPATRKEKSFRIKIHLMKHVHDIEIKEI